MLLIDVYDWATQPAKNAILKRQLAAAIANAAVLVLSESIQTFNHENRVAWANSVLLTPDAPDKQADQMIWGVLGNTTIQAELAAEGSLVPDSDLEFVVASLIDIYAP